MIFLNSEWQKELLNNAVSPDEVAGLLRLSPDEVRAMEAVTGVFPMSVPRYYLSLIDPNDPDDPIRRLAIPEGQLDEAGLLDTSGEGDNTVLTGMQHKYAETALILTTNQCAMYCRHCFRRRLVGLPSSEVRGNIPEMVRYVENHPRINNVLLSGGDALMLQNEELEEYLSAFSALKQLDFIRIGSRVPVTFPMRVTSDPELVGLLAKYCRVKQLYLVTHYNHPRELTDESKKAIKLFQGSGLIIKNQTVLLRGVNDSPEILGELLKGLTSIGVVPHYIFQCRPVKGMVNRFQLPIRQGSRIVSAALAMQNGLGKSVEYVMSHKTGKIAVLGENEQGEMLFKYKQAHDPSRIGSIFSCRLGDDDKWLEL